MGESSRSERPLASRTLSHVVPHRAYESDVEIALAGILIIRVGVDKFLDALSFSQTLLTPCFQIYVSSTFTSLIIYFFSVFYDLAFRIETRSG